MRAHFLAQGGEPCLVTYPINAPLQRIRVLGEYSIGNAKSHCASIWFRDTFQEGFHQNLENQKAPLLSSTEQRRTLTTSGATNHTHSMHVEL